MSERAPIREPAKEQADRVIRSKNSGGIMAEGLLGGILGEEGEKPDTETPESHARAEAFAAAVTAQLAAADHPDVARDTADFLREQAALLRVQKEHLEVEHPVRLATLRGLKHEGDLRRVGIRVRIAFQLFAASIAALVGAVGLLILHDAFSSRLVVIDPFRAPPGLAARGIDGVVVANGVLDALRHMQDATRSSSAALGLSGAWSGNIRLDVPDTGISIAELSRYLRQRFGHDVHIDGDLIETPSGALSLTVRGNGVPPRVFTGAPEEFDKLTARAAEYVYGMSQPSRWAAYLALNGRNAEAIEFCRTAVPGADPTTRAHLLNDWANALLNTGGSHEEALSLYRAAIRQDPTVWRSYNNTMNVLQLLGREEEAWRVGEELRTAAGGRPGRVPELMYQNLDQMTWNLQASLDAQREDAASNAGAGTQVGIAGIQIADILMRQHDPDGADLSLKTTKADPNDPTIGAITHFVGGRLAAEAGDTATALTELRAFGEAYSDPTVASNFPGYVCWVAPAEEAAGHPDRADAVLASAGNYVDCLRFRGDLLDGRGDWSGAQKAYAAAVALAPDLPAAYYSWGLAAARHANLADAEAKLKAANARGPNWADPLKAWGDVLARKGRTEEALAKYEQALKLSPNWTQLKDAREALTKPRT